MGVARSRPTQGCDQRDARHPEPHRLPPRVDTLDHTLLLAVREGMPEAWQAALRDGSAVARDETRRLTRLLASEGGDAEGPREQQYAVQRPQTLVTRPPTPVVRLCVGHVYDAMTAAVFTLPRVFDPGRGSAARHAHIFANEPAERRAATIGRAIRRVRHPAVPAEQQETAYCVALSGFAFGPEKRTISGRPDCPCGKGHEETVEHTFQRCDRSRRLWQLVLEPWRRITGEARLAPSDGRVVLFGDRSGTWRCEAEQGAFAGLEEVFSVIHKAVLHVLLEERNRDAAPQPAKRRTASQLYQKVQRLVQRVASWRWQDARAARHGDDGARMARFRKRWEAPGFACIPANCQSVIVTLFFRDDTRARYHRPRPQNAPLHFRNQQYAPPTPLAQNCLEIFIAGDADPRKKDQPPPPAGFGCVVVASGREERVFTIGGPITRATPGVRHTATDNLARLIAIARALAWAADHPAANPILPMGSEPPPVCVRYSDEYAAMIACGGWKAKKHKDAAAVAHQAWKRLKAQRGKQLYLQHAHMKHPRDGRWLREAASLALAGKRGTYTYAEDVS